MNRNDIKFLTGFTLIELSIVLVIIGLIVGGVLGGRELIEAAQIRRQVAQLDSYTIATNTFKAKYGGMPGDLPTAKAAQFGFASVNNIGNDDGLIAAASIGSLSGEITLYWNHLSLAGLIEGTFDGAQAPAARNANTSFPSMKLARTAMLITSNPAGVSVFSANGMNYYQLGTLSVFPTMDYHQVVGVLTAGEAQQIDSKIDDGKPHTGKAIVRRGRTSAPIDISVGGADIDNTDPYTGCVDLDDDTAQNISDAVYTPQNTTPYCSLRIRMN